MRFFGVQFDSELNLRPCTEKATHFEVTSFAKYETIGLTKFKTIRDFNNWEIFAKHTPLFLIKIRKYKK